MRLPSLVHQLFVCVHACVYARARTCVSVYKRERETEMRVGVCMHACGCVGGGDMVYGGGCEGGQDENSDYTCAEYI